MSDRVNGFDWFVLGTSISRLANCWILYSAMTVNADRDDGVCDCELKKKNNDYNIQ